jgi:hypothetical protein
VAVPPDKVKDLKEKLYDLKNLCFKDIKEESYLQRHQRTNPSPQ